MTERKIAKTKTKNPEMVRELTSFEKLRVQVGQATGD